MHLAAAPVCSQRNLGTKEDGAFGFWAAPGAAANRANAVPTICDATTARSHIPDPKQIAVTA